MVELAKLKAQFVCLIQEPHFYGVKPSSIDKSCTLESEIKVPGTFINF